jgi:hypothetical protein
MIGGYQILMNLVPAHKQNKDPTRNQLKGDTNGSNYLESNVL